MDPTPLFKPFRKFTREELGLAWQMVTSLKYKQSPFMCSILEVARLAGEQFPALMTRLGLQGEVLRARHTAVQEQLEKYGHKAGLAQFVQTQIDHKEIEYATKRNDPDDALYEGFIENETLEMFRDVRQKGGEFDWKSVQAKDPRAAPLIFRYIARNYPESLDQEGKERWIAYCKHQLLEKELDEKLPQARLLMAQVPEAKERGIAPELLQNVLAWQEEVLQELEGEKIKKEGVESLAPKELQTKHTER